ncbi:hypothetical protein JOD67_006788 [Tenggerimyces flavus]|nr:hypothetical protein [Tenggerimyces flavus]
MTSASTDGITAAPATPSSARLAMSIAGLVDNAANTEAIPNSAAPRSSTFFRPIRSPMVPMVTRNPAIRNP